MDRRLRLNGAVFSTDCQDLWVQVFNGVAPVTQNVVGPPLMALKSKFCAGEWHSGGQSLLDAGYDQIDTANTLVAKNNEFERVPDTAASRPVQRAVSGRQWHPDCAVMGYRSETFNDAYNTPLLGTDSTDLLDASALA